MGCYFEYDVKLGTEETRRERDVAKYQMVGALCGEKSAQKKRFEQRRYRK